MFRKLQRAGLPCGLLLLVCAQAHASWVSMTSQSAIPLHAVSMHSNEPKTYYICRGSFEGGLHPGWTMAGKGNCSIGWGGQEYMVAPYQIWVDDWQSASRGSVPAHAIAFGQEGPYPAPVTERPRYACAALDPGLGLASGKVASDVGSCDFGWGGAEHYQSNYSVLVDTALNFIDAAGGGKATGSAANPNATSAVGPYQLWETDALDVPDAMVSGYEAGGGATLYLCSAYYKDGFQIGKISKVMTGCDISWGGKEIQNVSPWFLLSPNWVTVTGNNIPVAQKVSYVKGPLGYYYQSAVIGGSEATGSELYLCQANVSAGIVIPGKTSFSLGGCSVGQNGKETIYPNYRILGETYTPIPVERGL